jgi:hypothetical protein
MLVCIGELIWTDLLPQRGKMRQPRAERSAALGPTGPQPAPHVKALKGRNIPFSKSAVLL